MPVCMCASTTPGKASFPLPSWVLFDCDAEMPGAILANFPALMAMSDSCTALPCGRTTRTCLMTRSYFGSAIEALLQVSEQAAVANELHEERGDGLAGDRLAGRAVLDPSPLQ